MSRAKLCVKDDGGSSTLDVRALASSAAIHSLPEEIRSSAPAEKAISHWFAVLTMPRHEKSAVQHLSLRGIEHFLPVYQKISRWRNRQKVQVTLPLFPRYVFVQVDHTQYLSVLQTPGVVRLVGSRAEPTPVSDLEMHFLRSETGKNNVEPYSDLAVGQRVSIKTGPMAGIEGILVRQQNGSRFVLTLSVIQQSVSVEVSAEQLKVL